MFVKRVQELEDRIVSARYAYYNKQPIISDEVYDAWVDELAELDGLNPTLAAIGSAPVSEWAKVTHIIPMGSLNKVNTLEEMTAWIQSHAANENLLVSEKLDGISCQVDYSRGKLVKAATRGDGLIGENITVNVLRMKGVPNRLPQKVTMSIRGEIVLRRSDYRANFQHGYSNTRNAASGIAKRYDGQGCEHLTVFFYKITGGLTFATSEEQFKYIGSLGFLTPGWFLSAMRLGVRTPHDIWVDYQQSRRESLDYDIDGLVVEVNNLAKQFGMGEKDLRPMGAVAFKFSPVSRETVLRGVTWQIGGTGRITPVANFDSVTLLGAQVSNASLYNYRYIRNLGLDVGARILVARANDIIPRVVGVVRGTGSVAPSPTTCPSCGACVVAEGEFHVCTNKDKCPAQIAGRIIQWITNIGVLEWGDVLVEKLVASGLVTSVPDLYCLTKEQISGFEHMGEVSAEKVLKLLHERKNLSLDRLLGSLSIPGVAMGTIKLMMDAGYDSFGKLKEASLEDLGGVGGIGPVKAEALYNWMLEYGWVVDRLQEVGVTVQEPTKGPLAGMQFCFTGEMKTKRSELEAKVKALGGETKTSVTKKLTYLVLADTSTSKAVTARRYGTKCLSEEEFLSLIEQF